MKRWSGRIASLLVGQTLLQLVNFFTGFLLLRWLSMEAMAQYGVVFGFQSTLAILADLGFSGCIVSLVGSHGDRPSTVGAYVSAARWFRAILFTLILPVAGVAFWFISHRQGWPLHTQALLFCCVIASIYLEGSVAWYRAALLIHQRINEIYRVQIFAAAGRLFLCLGFYSWSHLGALNLACVNAVALALISLSYRAFARPFIEEPLKSAPLIRREMLHYILPLVPGVVFYALQGQLTTFLIAIFGKTNSIAEISALGRLAQLFTLLGAVNGALLTPYFAKLLPGVLKRRYWQAMTAGTAFVGLLVFFSFIFPYPLLWIIGAKYKHLGPEVGWMVLSNGLGFLGALAWSIHSARKWVFWWATGCYICFVTVTQALFISFGDLSSTLNVLYLSCATNGVALLIQAMIGAAGFFIKRPPTATTPESSYSNLPGANVG